MTSATRSRAARLAWTERKKINPQPKQKKIRDPKYLKWLSQKQPLIGGTGDTVAHHVKFLSGGGMATKPSDDEAIPVSYSAHMEIHSKGEKTVLCDICGFTIEQIRDLAAAYYRRYCREFGKPVVGFKK